MAGGGGGGAVLPEGRQCMRSCLNWGGGGGGGGRGGSRQVKLTIDISLISMNEPIRHSHARILY